MSEKQPTKLRRGPGKPFVKGDPRIGHGKPGRSGRPKKAFKVFCREVADDPVVQHAVRKKARAADPQILRLVVEHAEGLPEQVVRVKGSDALEQLLSRLAGAADAERAGDAPPGSEPGAAQ